MSEFFRRLRYLLNRHRFDKELASEMEAHVEMAARDGSKRFGNTLRLREEARDAWGWTWIDHLLQDLRYATRVLRKSPGFTLVIILSLMLGIGANTAIFQLLNSVRLRSLPIPNPQELAEVKIVGGHGGMGLNGQYGELTRPMWEEIRRDHSAFSGVFAWGTRQIAVGEGSGFQLANAIAVSGDFFRVLGVENDTGTSQRVAVVNQTFVRRFLNGANPIGRALRTSPEPNYPSAVYEIVGVISDTKYNSLRDATPPMTFAPASQFPSERPWTAIMIHSNLPPAAVIDSVKHRIARKHPEIFAQYKVFETQIHDGLVRERLMAMLSGFFGLLAALLATVGLYGLIAYIVTQRSNEIGIRVALGANGGQVIGMVMREAGGLLMLGLAIGAALSLAAGSGANSLLFGLKSYDPFTLAMAIGLLVAIGAVSSFLPALRASKLDPMAALRCD